MNIENFFNAEFDEHEAVLRATRDALCDEFARLCDFAITALKAGNKLVLFGNGGSAADAQHIAAELVVRYKINRAPLAAIALTTDSSVLTAAANDFGNDTIFDRQLAALCKPGDVAIGITTSGNSENVVRALQTARDMGVTPAAFSGRGGGRLAGLADPLLIVPSETIARVQEMHILLGHMLCDVLEQECP
ncbi:MAG: SIS domain-containing protein [Pseudomonadota bacterium]|nr:SIS domain-containing protein [Pseudomonadota bacterium]